MRELLKKLLNPSDPTTSMRHAAFGVAVASSVAWLTGALIKDGITGEWVAAYAIFMGAVTTGKVVGAKIRADAADASTQSGE